MSFRTTRWRAPFRTGVSSSKPSLIRNLTVIGDALRHFSHGVLRQTLGTSLGSVAQQTLQELLKARTNRDELVFASATRLATIETIAQATIGIGLTTGQIVALTNVPTSAGSVFATGSEI